MAFSVLSAGPFLLSENTNTVIKSGYGARKPQEPHWNAVQALEECFHLRRAVERAVGGALRYPPAADRSGDGGAVAVVALCCVENDLSEVAGAVHEGSLAVGAGAVAVGEDVLDCSFHRCPVFGFSQDRPDVVHHGFHTCLPGTGPVFQRVDQVIIEPKPAATRPNAASRLAPGEAAVRPPILLRRSRAFWISG